MSLFTANKTGAVAPEVDLDHLLQNSYLLVIELRQGGSARSSGDLWSRCASEIERVRQSLAAADVSQRSIDLISHAQCALLDETVLTCADADARTTWTREPLQARFFSRHQAGQFLYEELREVLREPSPDPYVLTAYHRVLMLGFLGRYSQPSDPERQQLIATLNARVAPLHAEQPLSTLVDGRRRTWRLSWLRSPVLHVFAAALLLAIAWWELDCLLADLIASFATDQA